MIKRPQRRYAGQALRRTANIGPGGNNRIGTRTPITFTFSAFAGNDTTITFNQPVSVMGVPGFYDTSTPTITATGYQQLTADTGKVTFNAPATVAISLDFEDPAIRNRAGGYAQPGSLTFP